MSESEEVKRAKLIKASDKAVDGRVQHVLLTVSSDGRVNINGSNNLVNAIRRDDNLVKNVENTLKENFSREEDIQPEFVVSYPLLPCSPNSDEWKKLSIDKLRSILTKMINANGILRSGKRKVLGLLLSLQDGHPK